MVYPERAAPVALVQLSWPSRTTRARSSSGGRLGEGACGAGAGGGLVGLRSQVQACWSGRGLRRRIVCRGGRGSYTADIASHKRARHDLDGNSGAYFITNSLDQDMPPEERLSKK